KAYIGISESVELARHMASRYENSKNIVIAPMQLALSEVAREVDGRLSLCAQDVDIDAGAHTGSVPVDMVSKLGCSYSLVGHSETRYRESAEDNDLIGKKAAACVSNEITPIICFGERLDERLCAETEEVIRDQISSGVSILKDIKSSIRPLFAYEPVWAISSTINSREPGMKEVKEGIEIARRALSDSGIKNATFLYGGSINPLNVHRYLNDHDISGVLIGRAGTAKKNIDRIISAAKL
ncbi:MAG: triosephosphate isomerase, partial [Candidatus Micrarchaeota archaeon]|nr:triosephosphate isomerase [Candidatus Micrarchaeota archaeon]